ncbi:isochorismatase family protein [Nocardia nova SH22a]|uniref:Isochorismatase family protein n=1 Tax=Nocardia nova SH22a TaxID=1415166 RepID=W5TH03_9NOCA|nr:isochorismatase family cysteine hydrolase [Nocardia nova]AHH18424.1 isochorismatase family protein [Nocardia nova SH22a]
MTNALLLIDLQHGMCAPDGLLAASGIPAEVERRGVLDNARTALSAAREAGDTVIFVRLAFEKNFVNRTNRTSRFDDHEAAGRYVRGSQETDLYGGLVPQGDEALLNKGSVSAFPSTTLASLLDRNGVTSLTLAGVATHLAVESTAREAADRGFAVTVLEDACAGPAALHEHSVGQVLPGFAQVTSVAKWIGDR